MVAKNVLKDVDGYDYIVLQVSEGESEIVQMDLCSSLDEVCKVLADRIREELEWILDDTWDSVEQFQQEEPKTYRQLMYTYESLDLMDLTELTEAWDDWFADHWLFQVINVNNLSVLAQRL